MRRSDALPVGGDPYDALLLVSFGGPEAPEDVMPFLANVLRDRDVPEARMLEVAEQYRRTGGASPLNPHNRRFLEALRSSLGLPVYWGNRNWHPLLTDVVPQMAADGVRRAAAFVTSPVGGYSACRQYREDLERAREAAGPSAPTIDKLRLYFDHPGFVEPLAEHLRGARAVAGEGAPVLFTAHSVPLAMAERSWYELQLRTTAALVAARAGDPRWQLVWQSRSGPPQVPWLEPDVRDAITALAGEGHRAVVLAPIGFTSDHQEVVFDLDVQAREHAAALGVEVTRAGTPGLHPRFVAMVGELLAERTVPGAPVRRLSAAPPGPPTCGLDGCCPAPERPPARR